MYAIARLIGSGTPDDSYRSDVSGTSKNSLIPAFATGAGRGKPKFAWCLVAVESLDDATGTQLFKLPKMPLGTTVQDLTSAQRAAIKNKLDELGVPTAWITLDTTLRQVVLRLAQFLNADVQDRDIRNAWQ